MQVKVTVYFISTKVYTFGGTWNKKYVADPGGGGT